MHSTAYVEIRGQHSRGTWPRKGPDTYVAVQVVPDGVERLRQLHRRVACRRGIKIIYMGEGYAEHRGPRSALGQAIDAAHEFARAHNAGR